MYRKNFSLGQSVSCVAVYVTYSLLGCNAEGLQSLSGPQSGEANGRSALNSGDTKDLTTDSATTDTKGKKGKKDKNGDVVVSEQATSGTTDSTVVTTDATNSDKQVVPVEKGPGPVEEMGVKASAPVEVSGAFLWAGYAGPGVPNGGTSTSNIKAWAEDSKTGGNLVDINQLGISCQLKNRFGAPIAQGDTTSHPNYIYFNQVPDSDARRSFVSCQGQANNKNIDANVSVNRPLIMSSEIAFNPMDPNQSKIRTIYKETSTGMIKFKVIPPGNADRATLSPMGAGWYYLYVGKNVIDGDNGEVGPGQKMGSTLRPGSSQPEDLIKDPKVLVVQLTVVPNLNDGKVYMRAADTALSIKGFICLANSALGYYDDAVLLTQARGDCVNGGEFNPLYVP